VKVDLPRTLQKALAALEREKKTIDQQINSIRRILSTEVHDPHMAVRPRRLRKTYPARRGPARLRNGRPDVRRRRSS
jgi:hypothetical protein